jgi:hypothetical protein
MYYNVNVSGYETYQPHWFKCDCGKEEFERIVRESLDKAVDKFIKKESDNFVDGSDLMKYLLPILEKQGFLEIKCDHEISIGGECIYRNYDRKEAEIFTDIAWRKILRHNAKINKDMRDDDSIKENGKTSSIIK